MGPARVSINALASLAVVPRIEQAVASPSAVRNAATVAFFSAPLAGTACWNRDDFIDHSSLVVCVRTFEPAAPSASEHECHNETVAVHGFPFGGWSSGPTGVA